MNGKFTNGLILVAVLILIPFRWSNAQTPAAGVGRIKGTLTYYFNENSGDKADVGSKAWLIKGSVEIPDTAEAWDVSDKHVDLAVKTGAGKPEEVTTKYKMVKFAVADGNGNFEISDVPAGQYTLVIESNHSKRPLSIGNGFTMPIGKIKPMPVEIKAGETFDASTDFGMSTR